MPGRILSRMMVVFLAASVFAGQALSTTTESPADRLCVAGGVIDGVTVDCAGKRLSLVGVNGFVGCDGDREGQPAVLSLKNGAVVKNLRVAVGGGGHGIACLAGDCTLDHVVWEEVCEHAAGHYAEGGTFTILNSSAYQFLDTAPEHGGKPDKFFQVNAGKATLILRNFTAFMVDTGAGMLKSGKVVRSCGDCSANQGGRRLEIDDLTVRHVDRQGRRINGSGIDSLAGVNVRWDSSLPASEAISDQAVLRRVKIQDYRVGRPTVCVAYVGSRIHNASFKIGESWDSAFCDVRPEDVSGF